MPSRFSYATAHHRALWSALCERMGPGTAESQRLVPDGIARAVADQCAASGEMLTPLALISNAQTGGSLFSLNFALGSCVFLTGFWLHVSADRTIRNLRTAAFSGYSIPQSGWFKWVSNPNYLGEIVQWTGWAMLTWSWAGLVFALFTFCNLAPRAMANHRWYQQTFPDYPAGRRVLIPGVF